MEGSIRATEKGRWRALLSIVLAAVLALCMTPAGALEAHAASKTKSYVYNYVYGTYQGEYAIGFKYDVKGKVAAYKDKLKEIDIVSATKGVTVKIKASDLKEADLADLVYESNGFLRFAWKGCPGVIAVPAKSGGKIVGYPYSLDGKKLSNTKYQQVDYFGISQKNGGAIFGRTSGSSFIADVYSNGGKKTQTISVTIPKGCSDPSGYVAEEDGKIYYKILAESGDRYFRAQYQLKNGKFVKYSDSQNDSDDEIYSGDDVGGGVKLDERYDWETGSYRSFLVQPNGQRIELPPLDRDYDILEGLGVSGMDDKGVVRVYSKQGKLIKTVNTGKSNSSAYWTKSAVPNAWVLCVSGGDDIAFDASFKELSRSMAFRYRDAIDAGKLNGKVIYLTKLTNDRDSYDDYFGNGVYVDRSMNPIKIGGCTLVGGYYDGHKVPIHTFSNGRSVVIAKNFKGKYGVLDTAGNVLVPFSYSDYANVGGGDYIMMKASKGWQFVKVSQFASGKAVKGITYTVGKLKYKVTSTSSKNRTVTAVGHVSGTKAKGKLSIPSTVKIGGQKFKVTSVGSSAFKKSQITSVSLGSYVTTVGSNAFYGCKKLKTATLGKKVKTIGKNAFASCKKLSKITIKSKSLKSVGKGAIKGISKKAKIKVPSSKVKTYKKLFKSSTGFKKSMKVTK